MLKQLQKNHSFQDKLYDVFLSYSHEDEAWVEQVDSYIRQGHAVPILEYLEHFEHPSVILHLQLDS